ncbi:hypothetical protein ACIOMM_22225 [Streptomyces sp. NPDC087908]|uniref:hypothetical protein n=1 Tax=unclassified Streptomyces TaxID=2593676 RepID=UPI0011CE5B21|nr:hypothetical protein [Streptomyces sp. adm13(2018)]TXS12411.1 hypothetical protein EAO70_26930 [Streptomyces sp. adm13(2018)]
METLIALAAVAVLITFGTCLVHRLNAQHEARIAARHYSDPFPAIVRPPGHSPHTPTEQAARRRTVGTWP